jgi:hypothetical protein
MKPEAPEGFLGQSTLFLQRFRYERPRFFVYLARQQGKPYNLLTFLAFVL